MRTQAGFTYVGLLIAIVLLGVMLSQVGTVWRTQAQREREQELLFIGRAYLTAITSYYNGSPGGVRQFPQELNDLLEDKRWPEPRHHLRRLYADPMTGAADWTLLHTDLSGITGVASSAQGVPIKKTGFPPEEHAFEDAATYADWQFQFVPRFTRRRASPLPAAAD